MLRQPEDIGCSGKPVRGKPPLASINPQPFAIKHAQQITENARSQDCDD